MACCRPDENGALHKTETCTRGEQSMPPLPHAVFLATPGMGHLIPMAQLAKCVVARHGITATIVTFASTVSKTQSAFLASLPSSISSIVLPAVDLSDVPADAWIETRMSLECARSVAALTSVLLSLRSVTRPLCAFVTDLFGADAFDAAREAGVPGYLFFPSNLHLLSLLLHLPAIDATTTCEMRDLPQPLRLPGCVPIPGPDLLSPLQDRRNDCYKWIVHHGKRYRDAAAILVNSFRAVEPGPAEVLSVPEIGRPPVYVVGPIIGAYDAAVDTSESLGWLDSQPTGSVVFVSFGSGGALTKEQMGELALGLELSRQRFLWVVRSPSDVAGDVSANYYDSQSKRDPFAYLPEGFVARTEGVGKVVPSWAPQLKVLGHRSTGGFLTHCGWNSAQESIVNGIPMIAWPLYAEQRQNAVMLVDGIGVALRLGKGPGGHGTTAVVGREEVRRVVVELMEGEEGERVRRKVSELKMAAEEGWREGGESCRTLDDLAKQWIAAATTTTAITTTNTTLHQEDSVKLSI